MTNGRSETRLPRGSALAATVATFVVALAPASAAQSRDLFSGEDEAVRSFSIPLAREARRRAEDAREHVGAKRWGSAIAELQTILEEHHGDLLPAEWRASASRPSQYAAYPGAAEWARTTLKALPEEARTAYEERFGGRAREALEQARAAGDVTALTTVAKRWPLTRAARAAWWTLGDLELERGSVPEALFAWERALDLVTLAGEPVPDGAEQRRELARRLGGPEAFTEKTGFRDEGLPTDRLTRGTAPSIPRIDADSWSLELDLTPFRETRRGSPYRHNLHPVLADDSVLVNTSWWIYCIDSFTGQIRWWSGPPKGWSDVPRQELNEYFGSIDVDQLSLRPAVGGGVVVGLMQVPFSRTPKTEWQRHSIFARIPERRLHAFDIETGEELWHHDPILDWDDRRDQWLIDDGKNSFAQRMSAAASPVIVGSRVLLPVVQMQGRIAYHVACFELTTGERLWSTSLISGQRERNMFGRADLEFIASPLTVVGDRVIAQSELGTVAALDLFTGGILWESEYAQIAVGKSGYNSTADRDAVWRIAPPQVADDLVIATPSDCLELVGFELSDGRVHWGHRHRDLIKLDAGSRGVGFDTLIGADRDTVYFTGGKATALQKPGGFRARVEFQARWTESLETSRPVLAPAPRLVADAIVIPQEDDRLVLDRWTGETRHALSGPWAREDYGNAVVGDGALYTLGRTRLNGFFDWEVLLDRQRELLAAHPDDPAVILETAALFVRRARAVTEAGETVRARSILNEARKLLQPLIAAAGGPETASRRDRGSAEAMHELLRLEASVQVDLADSQGALRTLAEARPLAPTLSDLRDTLLQEERILRSSPLRRRLEVLAEIETRCGELPLPAEIREGSLEWLIGEAILTPVALDGWEEAELDMRAWVLLTRADASARERDPVGALRDLHEALARYGPIPLNESRRLGDLVCDRISRRLELDGHGIYREFEEDAATRAALAVEANDRDGLHEVLRLYPHSRVANDANRHLLEWAYGAGETATVAEMLYGTTRRAEWLPEDRNLGLLRLGLLLAEEGNVDFLRGLAEVAPQERAGARAGLSPEDRERIAEFTSGTPPPRPRPSRPQFTHDLQFTAHHADHHDFIAELAVPDADDPDERVQVYLRGQKALVGFSSAAPGADPWSYEAPYDIQLSRIAATARGIFVGSHDRIQALDVHGKRLWSRTIADARILTLNEHGGVVVAMVGETNRPARLMAFDAHGGIALWRISIPDPTGWLPPVLGEDVAVFLVKPHIGPSRAVIVDLYGGVVRREIELPRVNTRPSYLAESSWIEEGRLVVPSFNSYSRARPFLVAFDLGSGDEYWRHEIAEGEEFYAIVESAGRNYVVTFTSALGRRPGKAGIYQLDLGLRNLRRIASLDVGEEPIGLKKGRRTSLGVPYLFVLSAAVSPSGNTTPVRALHLPDGRRWVYHLPVPPGELYATNMARPAVSEECVAFAWIRQNERDRSPLEVNLELVDLAGGFRRERRELYPRILRNEKIELFGLGEALLVHRSGGSIRTRGVDVLEGGIR